MTLPEWSRSPRPTIAAERIRAVREILEDAVGRMRTPLVPFSVPVKQ